LLGGWVLERDDQPIQVAPAGQRLVALLALQGRQSRVRIAGTLWPETSEPQAMASLRSALWRLQPQAPFMLRRSGHELELGPDVHVDVAELVDASHRLLEEPQSGSRSNPDMDYARNLPHYGELLPGWYDDWVLVERERLHQLRLHGLEALADRLRLSKRYGRALDAALAATSAEPFRESAHRMVIQIHLAEGNPTEALRHFDYYRMLLRNELDLPPSKAIYELVAPYRAPRRPNPSAPSGVPQRPPGGAARPASVSGRPDGRTTTGRVPAERRVDR
jgi:DNA-binding SARP family transcriptional activator